MDHSVANVYFNSYRGHIRAFEKNAENHLYGVGCYSIQRKSFVRGFRFPPVNIIIDEESGMGRAEAATLTANNGVGYSEPLFLRECFYLHLIMRFT